MKILKRLIPVMLVAIMILAMASCDFNTPKNDPEKNKEHIIDAINSGEVMGDFMGSEGEIAPSVSVENLMDSKSIVDLIKTFALEGAVTIHTDNDVESGYFGIKDGVIALTSNNEEMYYFIEDDFKIVSVVDTYKGYEGYVSTELADMLESLAGIFGEEEKETEGAEDAEEGKNPFENIKLPEITAEDVTYDAENDRYILSEEYIGKVIDVLLDALINKIYEGSSIIEKNSYKAAIMAYVKEMNIVFYFRAKLEKMIGFGMTLSISDDLKKEMEVDELALELYVGKDAINANIDYKQDGSEMKVAANVVMDDKGMPKSLTFELDVLNNDYTNYICVDNEEHDYREVSAKQTLTVDLKADLTKREGEIVSFNYDQTISDYKIYTDNYWYEEESIDEELTAAYAGKTVANSIDLKVTGSNGGRNFTLNLVQENNDQIEGVADRNTADVVVSLDVKNFPQIPDAVENARQEALDEHDDYDFDYDFGFDY